MFPIMAGNSASTGYNLTRSLRFRASATPWLNRTFGSGGNQKTWTLSTWVKRGTLGSAQVLLSTGVLSTSDSTFANFGFNASDQLTFTAYTVVWRTTTQVFRDPSAWYHIVLTFDTTQATATNRVKLYVNGSQVTAFASSTDPTLNTDYAFNQAAAHYLGYPAYSFSYFDGYQTEINFVGGLQLTPSSFGSTNALTGVWQPARYTSTYGTNGFYLPFTDNSALTTSSNVGLGKDFSGNGNYWTTNNISITAGVTYDSMTDVPTLTSATAANFAVLNPLANGAAVPSGGNLNHAVGGSITRCNSTIMVSSGKWYFEATLNTAGTNTTVGIGQNNITNQYPGQDILSFAQEIDNARKINNDVLASYGTALTAGQVFMCAIDLTNLKLFFGGQGTWFASSDPVTGANPAYTLTAGLYCPISRPFGGSASISINFGQRPFTYTAPTGFVALNTYNLPTSTIVKGNTVMDATLYTGNSSTQTVTNAGAFKPDFVWIKDRSSSSQHVLTDSVRGVDKQLFSSLTNAEQTSATGITSLNSNGFSLGVNVSPTGNTNGSPDNFVAWQWQAGQGSSSSNTNGTITSTVSVNASAGFSVVTYTGTGANATVGHGLGVAPSLIIIKQRSAGATYWATYHASIGNTSAIYLNDTGAAFASSVYWNNTSPTSSVFTIGTSSYQNTSAATYVAYCWTPIAGFSAFGSYTGNGSADGPFIYLGFRPKFVMIKETGNAQDWVIHDTSRATYNADDYRLLANSSGAELNTGFPIDELSNGFKLRNSGNGTNRSGGNYIYMCFAENPTKYALAR